MLVMSNRAGARGAGAQVATPIPHSWVRGEKVLTWTAGHPDDLKPWRPEQSQVLAAG